MLDTIADVVGNIDLTVLHKVQEALEKDGLIVDRFVVGSRLDNDLLVFIHGRVNNTVATLDLGKVSSAWPVLIKNILNSLIVDRVRQKFRGDLTGKSNHVNEVVKVLKLFGRHHGHMNVRIHCRLNELWCVTHWILYLI